MNTEFVTNGKPITSLTDFKVDGKMYHREVDDQFPSMCFNNDTGKILLRVMTDGKAYVNFGYVGCFLVDQNNLWYFLDVHGVRYDTGNKNLIKAEMKIFKDLFKEEES